MGIQTVYRGGVIPAAHFEGQLSPQINFTKMKWLHKSQVQLIEFAQNKFQVLNHSTQIMRILANLVKIWTSTFDFFEITLNFDFNEVWLGLMDWNGCNNLYYD